MKIGSISRRSGNYWPTPDQELLLRAALLEGPAAADAWRELRPRLNPDDIDAASQRLMPLPVSLAGVQRDHILGETDAGAVAVGPARPRVRPRRTVGRHARDSLDRRRDARPGHRAHRLAPGRGAGAATPLRAPHARDPPVPAHADVGARCRLRPGRAGRCTRGLPRASRAPDPTPRAPPARSAAPLLVSSRAGPRRRQLVRRRDVSPASPGRMGTRGPPPGSGRSARPRHAAREAGASLSLPVPGAQAPFASSRTQRSIRSRTVSPSRLVHDQEHGDPE